jgi:hypothetical protein
MTLDKFFVAINSYDVDGALSCMTDTIDVTYPDRGRNWSGKARGRVVLTGILGMMERVNNRNNDSKDNHDMKVTYEIIEQETMTCMSTITPTTTLVARAISEETAVANGDDGGSVEARKAVDTHPCAVAVVLYTREDWTHVSGRTMITKTKYTLCRSDDNDEKGKNSGMMLIRTMES